jgi:hypothetical protein
MARTWMLLILRRFKLALRMAGNFRDSLHGVEVALEISM